jgi:sulfinoalanine decarboxylase
MDQTKVLQQVFDLIDNYRKQTENSKTSVVEYYKPEELKKKLELTIGEKGETIDSTISHIESYLKYSVRTGHKQFLNQLFGGDNFTGMLGEIIAAVTNASMYTYEVAPVGTLMELEVIRKMNQHIGWIDGEGSLLTGGSNTNLVAMLLARNEKFPSIKENGISSVGIISGFVSERAHYSMQKGANAIGIGSNNLIKVKLDSNGRMRAIEVEKEIISSIARGEKPFFIGVTTGTTETGSFDPIDEIIPLAKKYNIWLHVDGSWGGSLILSKKFAHFFTGIEKADSFSWNPHKLMNVPLVCSALLIKQKGMMNKHISADNMDYIFHQNDNSAYDLGPDSLQCGKRVESLKLWLAWKFYGDAGYRARMEWLMELAEYATKKVSENSRFQLMFPTQSLNINFRIIPKNKAVNIDEFNEAIRNKFVQSGIGMVNYCALDNGLAIRLILLNPDLTFADIDLFFDNYLKIALQYEQSTEG